MFIRILSEMDDSVPAETIGSTVGTLALIITHIARGCETVWQLREKLEDHITLGGFTSALQILRDSDVIVLEDTILTPDTSLRFASDDNTSVNN
jgi:hypothetical protein